jgi:hypothetical protein
MILTAASPLQPFVESFGSMALTPSTMLPLGTPLPQALLERERHRGALEEVVGRLPAAGALTGRPVLLLFLSCHCPFVKHIEAIAWPTAASSIPAVRATTSPATAAICGLPWRRCWRTCRCASPRSPRSAATSNGIPAPRRRGPFEALQCGCDAFGGRD